MQFCHCPQCSEEIRRKFLVKNLMNILLGAVSVSGIKRGERQQQPCYEPGLLVCSAPQSQGHWECHAAAHSSRTRHARAAASSGDPLAIVIITYLTQQGRTVPQQLHHVHLHWLLEFGPLLAKHRTGETLQQKYSSYAASVAALVSWQCLWGATMTSMCCDTYRWQSCKI